MLKLRKGYTTGTCAQAAAKASGLMLAKRKKIESVEVETPSGLRLHLLIIDPVIGEEFAKCGVVKDAGDDPDITHGAKIYAEVRLSETPGVTIKGGEGVGIVTKPGLAIPVGEHAINPTPRKMILKEISEIFPEEKGLEVIISVPEGESLAKRTFNPHLGIVGGISIIGTTGIVEPKSIDAYKTSLALRLDMLRTVGHRKAILVLGYVGERFCKEVLGLSEDSFVKIGDHVGFMLKECAKKGVEEVLLIGHIGKLVKVAAGQFDTHFRHGDRRVETITHHAKLHGADPEIVEAISKEKTAEATIPILKEAGLAKVFQEIVKEVASRAKDLVEGNLRVHCILLSLEGEVLGEYRA